MAIVTKPAVTNVWAQDAAGSPDIVAPADSEIRSGWPLTSSNPPRGFFNWILNQAHRIGRYIEQIGIADWDAADSYPAGAIIRDTFTDGAGFSRVGFYVAKVNATVGTAPHSNAAQWELWLQTPIAQSTNHTREIQAYRTALGHRRGGYDHMGMPGGQILAWDEDWADVTMPGGAVPYSGTSGGDGFFGRKFQAFVLNSTGTPLASSTVRASGADVSLFGGNQPVVSNLRLQCEFTAAQTNVVGLHTAIAQGTTGGATSAAIGDENVDVVIEWMATPVLGNCDEWVMGVLADGSVTEATFARITGQDIPGFLVARRATETTWRVFSCPVGGTRTVTDTGIAYNNGSLVRFRMALRGANVSDDGTARVFLYINGALATPGGIAMTTVGFNVILFFRQMVNAAGSNDFFLGPVRFRCNLFGSDVF